MPSVATKQCGGEGERMGKLQKKPTYVNKRIVQFSELVEFHSKKLCNRCFGENSHHDFAFRYLLR